MTDQLHTGLLVISRHAESEWNTLGKWTGLTDVNLSEKGHLDAEELGKLLKGISFNAAYTSELKRTHQTLEGLMKGSGHGELERHHSAALNERDYGELTGKNKWEVQTEIGDDAFKGIRRGWDYPVPGGETLKDVHGRVVPFFDNEMLPRLQAGQNILLVAHGNSIRALIKHLEDIHEDQIADVEMSFGELLVYHITPEGTHANKEVRRINTTPTNA